MLIRTVEFMYHTNKYILERKQINSLKRVVLVTIEILMTVGLSKLLPTMEMVSYTSWIIYACMVAIISIIVIIPVNFIVYKEDTKQLLNIIKNNFLKRKVEKI